MSLGIEPGMAAGEARRLRFLNVAAALVLPVAILFSLAEAPLIVDWGVSGARDWTIFALRFLASFPFALPLVLNARGRRAAARIRFLVWACVFLVGQALIYARVAPAHFFFLAVLVAAATIFPRSERRRMWLVGALCLAGFLASLWLRHLDRPLVPVRSPLFRQVTEVTVSLGALLVTGLVALAGRYTTEDAEERLVESERKAEGLLLNVLPESIAARLKESPGSIADGFDEVTVMFVDLVGFTPLSQKLAPRELVALMDRFFTAFDALADRHGLEKIKTIGDAYMVAAGLPERRADHAEAIAEMALEVGPVVAAIPSPLGTPLEVRVGIASGAAVAGVIGKRKFIYDLWGDTVNTASRLESHGIPGRIQVDGNFRERLGERYRFEERGLVEIKGKGQLATWFLLGRD